MISDATSDSILGLDSYNRGYFRGTDTDLPNKLGLASLITSNGDAAAQPASFYATAWSVDGSTVIAYRGIDYAPPAPLQVLEQVPGTASHIFYTASVSSRTTL